MTNGLFKYETKTLLTGYKIGLKNANLYVAVPAKYMHRGHIFVWKGGKTKVFCASDRVIQQTFNDKFRPGETYTLYYFLWQRVKKGPVAGEDLQEKLL